MARIKRTSNRDAAPSPTPGGRRAAAQRPTPSNVDHLTAQAELDATLFPHYLLGRQLALEQVVRELFLAAPDDMRADIVDRLRFEADLSMERLTEGIEDPKEEASTCGYVATLLQQGM